MHFPAPPRTILQQISSLVQIVIVIEKALPHDLYLSGSGEKGCKEKKKNIHKTNSTYYTKNYSKKKICSWSSDNCSPQNQRNTGNMFLFSLLKVKVGKLQSTGQLPVFINNVFLEHSHVHLFLYCLWPCICYNSRVE